MAIAFLFVVALIFDAKSKKPRSHRGFGGILSFLIIAFVTRSDSAPLPRM
jgi:Na+/H+-dicarboxylate symporter